MATTTLVDSSYVGDAAGEIIGKAFKEADTIARQLITISSDITVKRTIRKIDYGNGRQDFSCGFAPLGSVTIGEVVLEPKKIKNEGELCKEDFRNVWDSASMGFSAHNDNMPVDEEAALLVEILADTAEATGRDIWTGNEATTGSFGGLIPKFLLDATVIDVTAVAVTKANVLSKIEAVLNAIPVALRRKTDLVFGISNDVALAYQQALIGAQIVAGFGGNELQLKYGTYTLEIINDLPANTMVVYQKKNVYFGTGLLSDYNEVRIKDMDESLMTGTVRYKMVYTAGTAYVRGNEIVLYTTFV